MNEDWFESQANTSAAIFAGICLVLAFAVMAWVMV